VVDGGLLASALAHSLGDVEGAYNRAAVIERRRAIMAAWADYLTGETQRAKEQLAVIRIAITVDAFEAINRRCRSARSP
jgi:hypothetical protein